MAAKSAAKAAEINIHEYVGQKLKELRGSMPISDFARKNGLNQALLAKIEDGEATCLARLELLAIKNDLNMGYFFPRGRIPPDYPEH